MRIKKRTPEDFARAQVEYFETGAKFYRAHDQHTLARWADEQASEWRKKLPAVTQEAANRWE